MTEFDPANVAEHLPKMAKELPDGLAVAVADKKGGYERVTLGELDARSDKMAHALTGIGVTKGTRTVLMVKPSPEFFALTFALFKIQAVPVFVDPGMGIKNLKVCLAEAEPTVFIGIPKAHAARVVLGWARSTLETIITVGPRLFWGGHSLKRLEAEATDEPFQIPETSPEDLAAILFTSGSTGVPKGTVYAHKTFAAQVRMLKNTYGIEPGEVDLSTFPLFALFGPALGMASVVPNMDASKPGASDPAALVRAVHDSECTNMFASPALIEKIGRYGESEKVELHSLRRVMSAGAPASIPSLKRFSGLLRDEVEIFTPYGATESLPVASIGSHTILKETGAMTAIGRGVCVGPPVAEMEVAIIRITDEAIEQWSDDLKIADGELGEIVVKGPVVTERYYNRPESTVRAKIHDGEAIRHRMGDVGYLDDQGRLWMCGRVAHRLETDKGRLFTVPCEAIFNNHDAVYRSALVGVGERGSERPVLCVELEKGRQVDESKLSAELLELALANPMTKDIDTFLFRSSLPVDVRHNAKIFREQLKVWATKELA